MHGFFRRKITLFAIAGAMTLGTAGARAEGYLSLDHCTREDAQNAAPGTLEPVNLSAAVDSTDAAIEAEALHPLPSVTVYGPPHATTGHHSWWIGTFVDQFDLRERLRSLRRLRLVRLWDDARITVFFGVNKAGVAGLHIQQQDPVSTPWNHLPAHSEPMGGLQANALP